MRVSRENSTDLGFVHNCWGVGAVGHEDISEWASRAIDEEDDPPTFLYTMLDVRDTRGDYLDREIGFISGFPKESDDEWHYLRQIAVRRGRKPYSYLGPAADVVLKPERKAYIDDLFLHNFGIEVDSLSPLESFQPED